jgi:ABC-2 type transport system permease protein
MGAVLAIARLDLRRRLRNRTFLIVGIATPLVMAAIIGLAFGGGFAFHARIGIADADGSEVSHQLVSGLLSSNQPGGQVTFASIPPDAASPAVADGTVDSVIEVPAGFGASLSAPTATPFGVIVDVSKRVTADVTTSIAHQLASRVDTVRVAVAAAVASGGNSGSSPAAAQQVVAGAQDIQPILAVATTDIGGAYNPVAYFAPAMGMLFLFFTVGAGARSILVEREEGTLRRVRAAPVRDGQILVGKTAAVLVLGLVSMFVLWAITSTAFHAAWGDPAAVVLVLVGIVVAIAGISMLITAFARTEEQAQGLTSLVAFTLALLGGNFLSPGSMPPFLQHLALLTPNGWALRALTDIGASGAGARDVLPATLVMVGIGVAAGLFGLRSLRGGLER